MNKATPPLHAEVRAKVDAMLILYGNSVLTTQPITGPGFVEPPIHVAMRANVYTDKLLTVIADALLLALPEKHEPENRHLSTDNGGFLGNYCNRCKIFTFDKDTFEETGAWCLCYPYNEALDAVTRVIGELGGRRNPDHSESA